MAFAHAESRPIHGAVATLGVSQRVAFLRATYAHLGGALVLWAIASAWLMNSPLGDRYMAWIYGTSSTMPLLLVFGGFIAAGYAAKSMAMSGTSRVVQYCGLLLEVAAFTLMVQPILYYTYFRTGGDAAAFRTLVLQAALVTGAIFAGLTATVFVTKRDFSFLRGILMVSTFGALGVIAASLLFGFTLGVVWSGFVILLMAGYILFQTSSILKDFPPGYHVAAALMLFSTVATLFIHVLRLLGRARN